MTKTIKTDHEEWKDVPGYDGVYQVSSLGRIKSMFFGSPTILKPSGKRYLSVSLWKDKKSKRANVHRMVAEAFVSNPENLPQVNHKDGDKKNNCKDNLEWTCAVGNQLHAISAGLKTFSKEQHTIAVKRASIVNSKAVSMFKSDGTYIKTFASMTEATKETGIFQSAISACCNGKYGYKTVRGFIFKYKTNEDGKND